MAKKKPATKRGKGRPLAAGKTVGREALIDATRQLLQTLTPAQVTVTAVARQAQVDPALVRYYFGSRENLLLEVAQAIARDIKGDLPADAAVTLADLVHGAFQFTRSAKHMQRLMIEELDLARSPAVREKVREWNQKPVLDYQRMLEQESGAEPAEFDALFLHLAVIGISDFFVAGAPLIRLLVPPGTDMKALSNAYENFIVRLLMDGLRKR
ncbi:MAG: TetR/AcrR family transcriptional regulator [Gammaproteobacteria bacterium]|nr:TetR/AcrR family transcriptional regulator [Gammaproteobacteria bacterium]